MTDEQALEFIRGKVREAQARGLKLVANRFLGHSSGGLPVECCPIGACLPGYRDDARGNTQAKAARILGVDGDWVVGFTRAIDGYGPWDSEAGRRGHAVGLAIYQEFYPEVPHE